VFIGRDGLGSIQKREMQFALVRQAVEERSGRHFAVIPILLPGAAPDSVSSFLALNTWVDLRNNLRDADPIYKDVALQNLALAWVQAGDPKQAGALFAHVLQRANGITETDDKARILEGLASALVKAGDSKETQALFAQILQAASGLDVNYRNQPDVLKSFAGDLAKFGRIRAARRLALEQTNDGDKAITLAVILANASVGSVTWNDGYRHQ
jgi:thioredoxin-like negative regulator of GroEL